MNEISVIELKKMFDENEDFVLLDVREKEEFEAFIQGNYSVGRLSGRARFDLDVPILERKKELQKVIDEKVASPNLKVEMTGFVKLMTDMEVYLFQGQIRSFLLAFCWLSVDQYLSALLSFICFDLFFVSDL